MYCFDCEHDAVVAYLKGNATTPPYWRFQCQHCGNETIIPYTYTDSDVWSTMKAIAKRYEEVSDANSMQK